MDINKKLEVGDIVTLDDGRKVVITLVHPDNSFEWDPAPDKPAEEIKDEEKETVKAKTTKKASKTAKSKK